MSRFGSNQNRDSSMDEDYWNQLASVIDEKKERVWDALIEGFDKYSHVLVERSSLIQETDALKQQVYFLLSIQRLNCASNPKFLATFEYQMGNFALVFLH